MCNLQATGVLQSLDNQIDVTTGTLKFKARYENRDQTLFPNQFVNVHLLADTLKSVVLAPSAAIQFGTNGTFVYAPLDGDKKVTIRQLKVGASDGTQHGDHRRLPRSRRSCGTGRHRPFEGRQRSRSGQCPPRRADYPDRTPARQAPPARRMPPAANVPAAGKAKKGGA